MYKDNNGSKLDILTKMTDENKDYSGNIKKLIRADIALAKKNGEIDKAYRITIKENRGGLSYSFNININAVPEDATEEDVNDVASKLTDIQEAYNYDNSDIMTDYFDVGFYCFVSHAYKYK